MSNVVVIGARGRRQGIGEYVTRWFAEAGARVAAIVGTSAETIEEARLRLRERWSIECEGFVSLEEALRSVEPDIVAICSPYDYHAQHIEAVADAGVHCLCEKPLWWDPALDPLDETRRLATSFVRKGRLLTTVTQWPYTLPYFYQLCPEARGQPVQSFAMTLSPRSEGRCMVPDAVPHGLSMLEALVGPGKICTPKASFPDGTVRTLRVEFGYQTENGPCVEATFEYRTHEHSPRPAAYAINGSRVDRRITLPSYNFEFERCARRLALVDPLRLLVEDFLARCARGDTTEVALLASRARALREIWTSVIREAEHVSHG